MPLKIIGAGFGRTGTLSVYTALNQLGFPCYHMFEVLENPANKTHLDFWRKVANDAPGAQQDWEQVFAKYSAAVDNPAACVWRELLQAYPKAKVVLTTHPRGAEAWYESTMETIYFTEKMWQFKVLKLTTPFGRKFGDMTHKLVWQRAHQGTMPDRDKAIAHYHQHIADVKAAVPPEQLLVFSADQGWEPLCAFLQVPVPETEFPNVNDRAAIKKTLNNLTRGAYIILGLSALACSSLAYAAWRLIGCAAGSGNWTGAQPPQGCGFRCPREMQRVAGVRNFGMARFGIHAVDHMQSPSFNHSEQIGARAQAEVFGNVGQDQPAFAVCLQVCGEATEEATQHAAIRVVDGLFDGAACAHRNPGRIAHHQRGTSRRKQIGFQHFNLLAQTQPSHIVTRASQRARIPIGRHDMRDTPPRQQHRQHASPRAHIKYLRLCWRQCRRRQRCLRHQLNILPAHR